MCAKSLTVRVLSHLSHVRLFATLWNVICQAPLSMGFSRKEYFNGWPIPPPGDLSDWGIEPRFPTSPALVSGFFTGSATWKAPKLLQLCPTLCNLLVCM